MMDEGRWHGRWQDGMMGERQWRDGATFRLFAGRGGALTACRAANFAAAPCEFARKLAARPHGSARGGREKGALVRLLFWVGRAGVTLGAAQTRQGTLGSLDSPFAAASSGETGCEPKTQAQPRDHRGTAPSVRTYLFPETHRSSRAATIAAKTASTLSGSSWVQAQPAGRCPDPPRNLRFLGFSICCRVFGRNGVRTQKRRRSPATIAGLRRQFVLTFSQKRTAAVEPRPPR